MERGAGKAAASGPAARGAVITPAILKKLEAWCAVSTSHHACPSLREAIDQYRRMRGSAGEAPAAKVVAALYLLLVHDDDPLTLEERLRLDACLEPPDPLDASHDAA